MNFDQRYIPTKKGNVKYTFVSNRGVGDIDQANQGGITSFYQVCSFKDPDSNKYHMRKFVVNGNNEFISVKDYFLNKKQNTKFYQLKRSNCYKKYPLYSLNDTSPPNLFDICTSRSDLIGKDYDYTGYAPF